jgi:uncharacterized protein YdeI (YjbR/CyaY-like superfamily)
MSDRNPQVDGYIRKSKQWQDELQALRAIALDGGLTEEVKWRHPCYTHEGRNIVILGRFKKYCAMTFVKGALLKDAKGILAKPGENTQAARVSKFTEIRQIVAARAALQDLVRQAIEVEKAGLKVKLKTISEVKIPDELQSKFDEMPEIKAAFKKLTPGRQRAYILYFSSAKQSKTRAGRVEKCMPMILSGKGLDDE